MKGKDLLGDGEVDGRILFKTYQIDKETGCWAVYYIILSQRMGHWRILVDIVTNIRDLRRGG
jgi:hypothetical protein